MQNKKTTYADERRKLARENRQQKNRAQVDLLITQYLSFEQLHQVQYPHNLSDIFENIEREFERGKYSFAVKKEFFKQARKHISKFNKDHQVELPLPTQHLMTVQRSPLLFNQEWLQDSKYINEIKSKLWRYWHTTDDFNAQEVVGNLLLCTMLFSGVSKLVTLDTLLQELKTGIDIYQIKALNLPIIFLSVNSPQYGDLYDPAHALKKSFNFVPDRITQLWLSRFKAQDIEISHSSFEYMHYVFQKMDITLNPKEFERLLNSASTSVMQLDNVDLPPTLCGCLSEEIQSCGLSLSAFQRYLNPQLQHSNPKAQITTPTISQASIDTANYDKDYTTASLVFHKHILKCFKDQKNASHHLSQYLLEYSNQLPENAKRIGLWLISLFKLPINTLQILAHTYAFDLKIWQRYVSIQQKLRHSSIYSYYTKLAESWLLHSQDFLEDDLNHHLADIYNRMLNEVEKSKGQKLDLLKRFHRFQQLVFDADAFPLDDETKQFSSPKAELISHHTFKHLINHLTRYEHSSYTPHDIEMLNILYTIAFRTGMRINEILGLRVKDVEGTQASSIWIRPYRSNNDQHLLKTDSAERNLNLKILLIESEHECFKKYCLNRRLNGQPNSYLFTLWNSESRLKPYHITTPFTAILDQILPQHRYSFHSFRHTASNHLSMILTMDFDVVKAFTDYDEAHYHKIRAQLLRSQTPQDSFYLLAHLIGHIDPTETFRSYLHLNYLIAGYEILKFDPLIEQKILAKICPQLFANKGIGYKHPLSYYADDLNKLMSIIPFDAPAKVKPLIETKHKTQKIDHFIAGTVNSGYRYTTIAKVLKKLDLGYEVTTLAQQYNLPLKLVERWQNQITQIKQLKNRKKVARFVINPQQSSRILPHVESTEEKLVLEYFFKQLNTFNCYDRDLIRVIRIFQAKANVSHPGLSFSKKDLHLARDFMDVIYPLFPKQHWHISVANNHEVGAVQKELQYPQICFSINSNLKKSIRLELVSTRNNKSLVVFKYCLMILMILIN